MVLPITGPLTRSENRGFYWSEKTWYRQKRPYDRPLPYQWDAGWTWKQSNAGDAWRFAAFARSFDYGRSYAQAYSRLVDKLGEPAGLGITLAQWKQADEIGRAHV